MSYVPTRKVDPPPLASRPCVAEPSAVTCWAAVTTAVVLGGGLVAVGLAAGPGRRGPRRRRPHRLQRIGDAPTPSAATSASTPSTPTATSSACPATTRRAAPAATPPPSRGTPPGSSRCRASRCPPARRRPTSSSTRTRATNDLQRPSTRGTGRPGAPTSGSANLQPGQARRRRLDPAARARRRRRACQMTGVDRRPRRPPRRPDQGERLPDHRAAPDVHRRSRRAPSCESFSRG